MGGYIYKPQTHKGPVFIDPNKSTHNPPQIKLADGRVITAVRGDQAGGTYDGHEGRQFVFPNDILGQQGATLIYNGQTQVLGNTNMSYRGGAVGSLSESGKGAIGDFSGGGGGGSYSPNQVGPYGFAPPNLIGQFPSPFITNYQPIQAAPYKFTDVKKFAKQYGEFNRGEMQKNYGLSKSFALDTLGTELQSLRNYVPAASALKRSETSADNIFNQQQRTQQLDTALPGVRNQLASQGQRAETFATGRVPGEIEDRAFEVGVRSGAADNANAGGFGARSSVARKASDLMSVGERIKLSQYGDSALSNNITQRTNVELAPTEYSNAGQQVQVMPSQSFSQLGQQNFSNFNQTNLMPTSTAFSGQVQQNQFVTGQEQQTRQFNASNTLQNDQFNATNQNQFAMDKFGYQVGLGNANTQAAQGNLNTGVAIDQQNQATQAFKDSLSKAQNANEISSILQSIGLGATAIKNIMGGFGSDGGAASIPDGGTVGGTGSNTSISNISIPDFGINDTTTTSVGGGTAGGTGSDTPTGSGTPDFGLGADSSGPNLGVDLNLRSSTRPKTMAATTDAVPSTQVFSRAGGEVLAAAGIHESPQPNTVPIGVNTRGAKIYADRSLVNSSNIAAGSQMVAGIKEVVAPLNVLSVEDTKTLDGIASVASDVNTIASLTDAAQRKDQKAFVNILLNKTKQSATDLVSGQFTTDKGKSQAAGGVGAAYVAAQLYENWNSMSPAQKSMGIAALGIKGMQTSTGTNLANTAIIKPTYTAAGKLDTPGLTLGQGLDLLSSGYNTYALASNWGELNTIQKIIGTTGNATSLASTAKSMGLLGYGAEGAAVPGVTQAGLNSIGAVAAPQYAVGAQVVPTGTAVPAGYSSIATTEGGTVIAPTANAATAAPSTLQIAGGATAIAAGAYQVYSGWGGSGKSGVINGALGGSAMAAGMYALGATNPVLLAAVVAASIIVDASGGGKGKDQTGRDQIRGHLKKTGLADDDYQVTLADGTKADIGMDGHGDYHDVTNEDLLAPDHKGKIKKLSAYDVDYTNDLDYAASMGGSTLSRLLSGGTGKSIDQLGGQLGNASLKNVGFNQNMTEENYNKVMQNQRAMYAQSGIKSKDEGKQLANQAFAEGRIDATQLVSMQQSLDMVFNDNSYSQARKLMEGRHAGIAVAAKSPDKKLDASNFVPWSNNKQAPLKITGLPPGIKSPIFTKNKVSNSQSSWMR